MELDQETLSCPICLDLPKDPVTIPCGHSYCLSCIKTHWDTQDANIRYSCPQCRKTLRRRPVLVKNTMLAAVVEELKKSGLRAAPADHCYAGAKDVACDVCTGRKLKALKSCLHCLASYCERHLQPHYDAPTFKKHKLMEPCEKLQENICSHHDEVMKLFCRTDGQSICYLCTVDEHKDHDTVSVAAERTQRQRELELCQHKITERLQDAEKDLMVLQEEVNDVNRSADKAVEDSEEIFTQMIRLMEKRRSEVTQQIRTQQETQVRPVQDVREQLEQEISELRRKDHQLKQLSLTEDHNLFLCNYSSSMDLPQSTRLPWSRTSPPRYFEEVTAAVSEVRAQLWDILTRVDDVLPQPGPKTRAEFLQSSCDITLDPNTANTRLLLSEGNRRVTVTVEEQSYSNHPDRFTHWWQVLSSQSLAGRCYWEVKWNEGVGVAAAYKNISRTGSGLESELGFNEKSWTLFCNSSDYIFTHNRVHTRVSGPQSSRIGVYLDHRAGILSFYSVSDTMTLLHRVHTTFTQPLHAALELEWYVGSTAEFCQLK